MSSRILVVDLEATCSDDGSISAEEMEIIEIGACWTTRDGQVLDRFQQLVKPLVRPTLTPFCKQLIGISQEEVDSAPLFPVAAQALQAFADHLMSADTIWISWGTYDHKQLISAADYAPSECQAAFREGTAHRQGGRNAIRLATQTLIIFRLDVEESE